MQHKEIVDLMESRFEEIEASFKGVLDGFGIEEIHLFRIEVKKLKAFLRILQTDLKDPTEVKLSKFLKKSYKLTGTIRGLQLQRQKIQQVVREVNDIQPENYLNLLTIQATENMAAIEKLIKTRKSLLSGGKNVITILPDKLNNKSIQNFIQAEAIELREIVKNEHPQDESLHRFREILKDLQYNWLFVKKFLGKSLPSTVNDKDYIKLITDLIGNFHDACKGLNLLEPNYIDQISDEKERILLLNIKREWQIDKLDIRQQIETELKKVSADPVSWIVQKFNYFDSITRPSRLLTYPDQIPNLIHKQKLFPIDP
jgi:CHAD domain-containing protein